MALNPLTPRLRVFNKSHDVAKLSVNLAPGDEIEVSADVAGQLADQRAPIGESSAIEAEPAKKATKKATKKAAGS